MAILNTAKLSSTIPDTSGGEVSVTTSSNTHRANNISTDITIIKNATKNWVIPEDKLIVTTTITNNTDNDITDIYIKDTIGEGASFIEGTVKISDQSHTDFNPITGFTMPVVLGGSGNSMSMSYEILIDKYLNVDEILNKSKINITLSQTEFELESNQLGVTVLNNEVYVLKEANTTAVKSGDTITYTITISNEGTLKNTNVMFTDPLPDTVTFVDGSVKIDDVEQTDLNPITGFALKDLDTNDSTKVEFKVLVK